jgi:hypothetical protein
MNKIVTYGTMKYTTTAITALSKTAVVTPKKVVLLSSRRWFPSPSFRLRHRLVPFVVVALEHVDLLQAIFPVDVNSRNPTPVHHVRHPYLQDK